MRVVAPKRASPNSSPCCWCTAWPSGNNACRISASVMGADPFTLCHAGEILRPKIGHGGRVDDAEGLPKPDCIGHCLAEPVETLLQPQLLTSKRIEGQAAISAGGAITSQDREGRLSECAGI